MGKIESFPQNYFASATVFNSSCTNGYTLSNAQIVNGYVRVPINNNNVDTGSQCTLNLILTR